MSGDLRMGIAALFGGSSELDVVSGGGDAAAFACPVGVEELAAGLVDALVSVRAEEIALRLEKIGGQALGAIAVKERERRGKCRSRHAELDGMHERFAP